MEEKYRLNLIKTRLTHGAARPRTMMRLLGKDYVEEQTLPALERLIDDLESGTHTPAVQA